MSHLLTWSSQHTNHHHSTSITAHHSTCNLTCHPTAHHSTCNLQCCMSSTQKNEGSSTHTKLVQGGDEGVWVAYGGPMSACSHCESRARSHVSHTSTYVSRMQVACKSGASRANVVQIACQSRSRANACRPRSNHVQVHLFICL